MGRCQVVLAQMLKQIVKQSIKKGDAAVLCISRLRFLAARESLVVGCRSISSIGKAHIGNGNAHVGCLAVVIHAHISDAVAKSCEA